MRYAACVVAMVFGCGCSKLPPLEQAEPAATKREASEPVAAATLQGRAGAFSNKQLTKNEFAALVAGRWGSTVPLQATGEERPDGSRAMFQSETEYVFTLSPTKEIHGTYETAETSSMDGNKSSTQASGSWVIVDNPKRNRDGSFTAGAQFFDHAQEKILQDRGDSAYLDRGRAEIRMKARGRLLTVSPSKLLIENFTGVFTKTVYEAGLEWRGSVKDSRPQAADSSTSKDSADVASASSKAKEPSPPNLNRDPRTITSLTPEMAASLVARHDGELCLDSLSIITPEAAAVLSKHKGWLRLKAVSTITPDVAAALAKHQGQFLHLGITAISDNAALALASYRGDLYLPELSQLSSVFLAGQLISNDNQMLGLDGVTTITPEVAKVLAKHKNKVTLNGLTTITPEVAAALAKHRGSVSGGTFLSLGGLTQITPAVDAVLRANPAIFFPQR